MDGMLSTTKTTLSHFLLADLPDLTRPRIPRFPLSGWGTSESVLKSALGTVLGSPSTAALDIGEEGTVARPGGADEEGETDATPAPLSWSMRSSTSPYPLWAKALILAGADTFDALKISSSYHCRRRERWSGEMRNIMYLYLEKRWRQLTPVTAPPLEEKDGSGPQTKVSCDTKSGQKISIQ
jgi:hypothetical protein